MESLDALLDALDTRAEHIASGKVVPVESDEFHARSGAAAAAPSTAQDTQDLPEETERPTREKEPIEENTTPTAAEDSDAIPASVEQAVESKTEHSEARETVVVEAADDSDVDPAQVEYSESVPTEDPIIADSPEEYLPPQPEEDDPPSPGWTRRSELLYDDMLRLFRLGDSDGALISLERLLTSTPLNADLEEFVQVNEDRLLELYVAVLGKWASKPVRATEIEGPIPPAFLRFSKIAEVLELVDGSTSFADIVSNTNMTRLETTAVLSQLVRSKLIVVEGA
jgi:hypothetical protein